MRLAGAIPEYLMRTASLIGWYSLLYFLLSIIIGLFPRQGLYLVDGCEIRMCVVDLGDAAENALPFHFGMTRLHAR